MEDILFKNGKIILEDRILPGSLLTQNGKIASICPSGKDIPPGCRVVNLDGQYLSPGFIDVHTHGGGGYDFMDGDLESIYQACRMHMLHGTTTIVPTTITGTKESLFDFVKLFNQVEPHRENMPNIPGLHLEGPYFSYSQRGAQDSRYLRNPEKEEYLEVLRLTDRIIRWSFAVELDGSAEFLKTLNRRGIVSSLAHSDATCHQVMEAHKKGIKALTHFYSGMSDVKRSGGFRIAGAVQAGYLLDDLFVELIVDGCHLPRELVQLTYKIKGADRICFVTDSMRGAGMPDGTYILGNKDTGLSTVVEDGVAKLPDRTAFAGSVATMDRLLRTGRRFLDIPLWELVKMVSLTPSSLINMQGCKGSIQVGKDADLVVLDPELTVRQVMVMGRLHDVGKKAGCESFQFT